MVSDAFHLYVLQALNYLGSFLALPYLLRVLGPHAYGTIALAQSLVGYAVMLTEYGYGLTATRDVAAARGDPAATARVFWTTIWAKLILMAVSGIALAAVVMLVPGFRDDWPVFALCGTLVVGYVVFPQWYFQGQDRLRDATIAQVIAKFALIGAMLVLVRSPADTRSAAFLMSATQLGAAAVALALGKRLAPDRLYRPTASELRRSLGDGWPLFAGLMSTTVYLQTNALILGIMSGKRPVAFYSLGYSLALAVQGLSHPVMLAVFPRVSRLFSESPAKAWALAKRSAWLLLPAMGIASLLLGVLARFVVELVGGPSFAPAVPIVRIMAVLPFASALATVLGSFLMVNLRLTRQLNAIYLGTGILDVALLPLAIWKLDAIGAALSLAFAVTLSPLAMLWVLWRTSARADSGRSAAR